MAASTRNLRACNYNASVAWHGNGKSIHVDFVDNTVGETCQESFQSHRNVEVCSTILYEYMWTNQ